MSDCAIKAIAHLTDQSEDAVWPVAVRSGWRPDFGMHAGHIQRTLKAFGWSSEGIRFDLQGLTIAQMERRLAGEKGRLIITVKHGHQYHCMSYVDGDLRGTLGMRRARVRGVSPCIPLPDKTSELSDTPTQERDPDESQQPSLGM